MIWSRKVLLISLSIFISCGIIGPVATLRFLGYWSSPPPAARQPLVYPGAQNTTIVLPPPGSKQRYAAVGLDTTDEPAEVIDFYQDALYNEGWRGSSDARGPADMQVFWCSSVFCRMGDIWVF